MMVRKRQAFGAQLFALDRPCEQFNRRRGVSGIQPGKASIRIGDTSGPGSGTRAQQKANKD